MIKFNELIIEGFGSICNELVIDLSESGVHVVRGKNGSGKTTIFNALIWCLYGVNLKGVKISDLSTKLEYRTDSFKGCRVCLEFWKDGTHFIVARHIDYKAETIDIKGGNQLLIWKDQQLIPAQHKEDSQEFLREVLGIDSSIFLSSILFGQRMKRFIEASPTEKRKLFESIFDLSYIDLAKKNSSDAALEIKDNIKDLEYTNNSLADSVLTTRENIRQLQVQIDSFEKIKKEQVDSKKDLLKSLVDKKRNLSLLEVPMTVDIEDFSKRKFELTSLLTTTDFKLNNLVSPDEIEKVCNVCGAKLSKSKIDQLKEKYEEDLTDYRLSKKVLSETLEDVQKSLSDLDELMADQELFKKHNLEVAEIINKNQLTTNELENIKTRIDEVKVEIEEISNQSLNVDSHDIDNLLSKIISDESSIENNNILIDENKNLLEVVEWWSKVGFTSKGLKGYILDSALTLLNKSIFKYSQRLGIYIRFSIDTSKVSKPFITKCFNGDVELNYEEFSGGEKARIDVATAFAMHDLVSSNIEFNVLIMDEIFEGLDNDGIEDVFDLIRMKGEGKSLYVITHSEQIDSLNTKRIDVYKTNSTYIK